LSKRKMRLLPRIIIIVFALFIFFLFALGVWDTFFHKNYYPIAYEEEVALASDTFGVDEAIIYSIIYCESSFNREAVSNLDARGLMQMIPTTYEWLCELDGIEYAEENLFDAQENVYYGTKYLSMLYEKYKNWDAVFAAYHAGNGRVDKWLEDGTVVIDADGKLTGIPINATEVYVEKVNDALAQYIKLLEKEN